MLVNIGCQNLIIDRVSYRNISYSTLLSTSEGFKGKAR